MKKMILVLAFAVIGLMAAGQVQQMQSADSTVKYFVVKDSVYTQKVKDSIDIDYLIYQDAIGGLMIKRDFILVVEIEATIHSYQKDLNKVKILRAKIYDQWLKGWRLIFYKPRGGKVIFL